MELKDLMYEALKKQCEAEKAEAEFTLYNYFNNFYYLHINNKKKSYSR